MIVTKGHVDQCISNIEHLVNFPENTKGLPRTKSYPLSFSATSDFKHIIADREDFVSSMHF